MLGVHFAITEDQERSLLAADGDDDAVAEILEELEESWDDDQLKVDTDKAWIPIHRCLTDGTLDPDGGAYPLSHAVLGGRHLHEEFYVVYVAAAEVRDVAEALRPLDEDWFRDRFADALRGEDDDFEYTWTNYVDLRGFYDRAAASGRAVLFTAT
ncbi:YfbM family protein [Cryptosporangium aurantiacum]|uniref:DUF1877 domain-containing protein n=1 Tax=Cryptosporangium aurantiacum TaxID=134849 RepID=A0A1M7TY88_9ACTN|nr:YfbM family protein [Cryptosporangium aurantiacum]SHN75613.1 protein of unknown function [Cryptosporangium aurantiacum]